MFFSCPISSVSGRAGRRRRGLHWVGRGRCPVPVFGVGSLRPVHNCPNRPGGRRVTRRAGTQVEVSHSGLTRRTSRWSRSPAAVYSTRPPPNANSADGPPASSAERYAGRRRAGGSSAARRLDIRLHRQGVRRAKPPAPLVRKGRAAPGVRRGSAASPSPEPNVRTLGRLTMTPNGCHGQPPCLLICRPSVSLHRPELRRRAPGCSPSPALSFRCPSALDPCPAPDVRPCSRSRPHPFCGGRSDRSGGARIGFGRGHGAALPATSCSAGSAMGDCGWCAPAR